MSIEPQDEWSAMLETIKRRQAVTRSKFGFLSKALALTSLTWAALILGNSAALADLRLCNKTESKVGVAIGYKDKAGWVTEGWWNISSNSCETLFPGALVSRYYYIYAVDYDQLGEWGGRAFMCTRDKEFTIRGIEDCVARGYERTGFFEIDTGEQSSWTVQLTEPVQQGTGGR